MRVEVKIGTIEIDALPEGMSEEALRAAVAGALTAQIRAGAVPGLAGRPADAIVPAVPAQGLGAQIARGMLRSLER